jgi:hypothetical protein
LELGAGLTLHDIFLRFHRGSRPHFSHCDEEPVRPTRAAAKKDLAKWEGEWTGNGGQRFIVKGDRWMWGDGSPWMFDDTT